MGNRNKLLEVIVPYFDRFVIQRSPFLTLYRGGFLDLKGGRIPSYMHHVHLPQSSLRSEIEQVPRLWTIKTR